MSVDQFLFGLNKPLGRRRKLDEPDFRPLGPLHEITQRLLRAGLEMAVVRDGVSTLRMGEIEVSLSEDPVFFISARRCAPWELVPLVDALDDGGAMAILDPQRGTWHAPSSLRVGTCKRTRARFDTKDHGCPHRGI
jgi:hypothetical protein